MSQLLTLFHNQGKGRPVGRRPSGGGGDIPDVPWYLAGGVPLANCVAAYQAKGAADYATSKTNLANSGTHDATEGVAPTWESSTGWVFNGSTNYLITDITGVTINNAGGSVIIRQKDIAQGDFGGETFLSYIDTDVPIYNFRAYGLNVYTNVPRSVVLYAYDRQGSSNIALNYSDNTICIAGYKAYYDGVYSGFLANSALDPSGLSLPTFYFGCSHYVSVSGSMDVPFFTGSSKFVAIAFYDIILTDSQVAAITTAMQAL